jgi:hypothetical protein
MHDGRGQAGLSAAICQAAGWLLLTKINHCKPGSAKLYQYANNGITTLNG